MKKLFLFLIIGLLIANAVFAKDVELNPAGCETFGGCFDKIVTGIFYLSIVIVCASIIIAAVLFVLIATPNRIALAKKIVLFSVGFFVIMVLIKIISWATKDKLSINS